MKIGEIVRTEAYQNVGVVFDIKGRYAKVLLDKHRLDTEISILKKPLFLKQPEDLMRASWYHFNELERRVRPKQAGVDAQSGFVRRED